eukprot:Skav200031  [mRNA]  locus=scaffold225:218413:218667:+ [translate_table: standard]
MAAPWRPWCRTLVTLTRPCLAARDAYSVMGLDRGATQQEVKERFRHLAKPLETEAGDVGWDGRWLDGLDGWLVGWMVAWLVSKP